MVIFAFLLLCVTPRFANVWPERCVQPKACRAAKGNAARACVQFGSLTLQKSFDQCLLSPGLHCPLWVTALQLMLKLTCWLSRMCSSVIHVKEQAGSSVLQPRHHQQDASVAVSRDWVTHVLTKCAVVLLVNRVTWLWALLVDDTVSVILVKWMVDQKNRKPWRHLGLTSENAHSLVFSILPNINTWRFCYIVRCARIIPLCFALLRASSDFRELHVIVLLGSVLLMAVRSCRLRFNKGPSLNTLVAFLSVWMVCHVVNAYVHFLWLNCSISDVLYRFFSPAINIQNTDESDYKMFGVAECDSVY